MRLFQVAGLRQVRHHIADCRRAHAFAILLAGNGLRRDRIPGGNVAFDNGVQDQFFAGAHGSVRCIACRTIACHIVARPVHFHTATVGTSRREVKPRIARYEGVVARELIFLAGIPSLLQKQKDRT